MTCSNLSVFWNLRHVANLKNANNFKKLCGHLLCSAIE